MYIMVQDQGRIRNGSGSDRVARLTPTRSPPLPVLIRSPYDKLKDFAEPLNNSIFNFPHINLTAQQILHGSHLLTITCDDQIEVTEISVYVERKPVGSYPTGNVNPNRRNLSTRSVYAG